MKIGFKQFILTTAIAAVLAPAALAQSADNPFQRGRYTAVTERNQPDFDPEPLRAGAFYLRSSVGLSAEYNDNIFATETLQDDDTIVRLTPQIEARSNWTAHELKAGLSIDSKQYVANSSESVTDYNGFLKGRLDVQRSFQLTGSLTAAHITEPRYAPAGSGAPDPAQYNRTGFSGGGIFRTDRIQLEASAGVTDDDFDLAPGAVNRDVSENYVYGRASYSLSPDVSFFLQGRKSEQDYDDPGSLLNPDRDGERSSFEIGTSFELQAPFRGEIAIGSVKEDKVARPDLDGLSASAKVEWFPTQLTTVTFRANSNVFDPGLSASASALDTEYGVRIDHELYRNIILYGDLGAGSFDFEGIDRKDDFTDFSTGLAWKLNKNARLEADYRLHTQDSSGANRDRNLDQNIFSVGFRFYP